MTAGRSRFAADIFDHQGRLRLIPDGDRWSLYTAFAKDGAVKVGVTARPVIRVYEVHTQQRPIKAYLWTWVGEKAAAYQIESFIKEGFKGRHIEGEWFRFDYAQPEDKAEFHAVTRQTFQAVTRKELTWTKGDMGQMLAYVAMQKELEDWHRKKGRGRHRRWG